MTNINISPRAYQFVQLVKKRLGLREQSNAKWRNRRTKHVVQSGETLESIAESQLGDARLAGLIVIINRAAVRGIGGAVDIQRGVALEMPAPREVKTYRVNYLGGEESSRTRRVPSEPISRKEAPKRPTVITGDPQSDEEFEIFPLGEVCRVAVSQPHPVHVQFSVRLQTGVFGSHVTIAAYESFGGRTQRMIYRRDGTCSVLDIDLPARIAKEMAMSDFLRNWQQYYDDYFLPAQSSAPSQLDAWYADGKELIEAALPSPYSRINFGVGAS